MEVAVRQPMLPVSVGDYLPFAIAFVVAALGAYPVLAVLRAMKSRQNVSKFAPEAHQKKQGTPTMGGLIVILGFSGAMIWSIYQNSVHHYQMNLDNDLLVFSIFTSFALIGFVDDFVVPRLMTGKRGLGWKQKIVLQFSAAFICPYAISHHVTVQLLVGVFFILFFSNAYNFSDGLDALAGLLLLGFAGGLLLLAGQTRQLEAQPYLLALLGAILPFLWLNKPKAKVFMGDVGSLPIGAVLGLVVVMILLPTPHPLDLSSIGISSSAQLVTTRLIMEPSTLPTRVALLFASGMMIVELVPVPLQILSVKLRKKKLFSFTPIHHAFERKGWPEVKVVIAFAACQFLLSTLAVGLLHVFPPCHHLVPAQSRAAQSLTQQGPGRS